MASRLSLSVLFSLPLFLSLPFSFILCSKSFFYLVKCFFLALADQINLLRTYFNKYSCNKIIILQLNGIQTARRRRNGLQKETTIQTQFVALTLCLDRGSYYNSALKGTAPLLYNYLAAGFLEQLGREVGIHQCIERQALMFKMALSSAHHLYVGKILLFPIFIFF